MRGRGLLLGVELVEDAASNRPYPEGRKLGDALKKTALRNGLIMRIDPDWFAVSPPLIASEADLDELGDLIEKSLREAMDLAAPPTRPLRVMTTEVRLNGLRGSSSVPWRTAMRRSRRGAGIRRRPEQRVRRLASEQRPPFLLGRRGQEGREAEGQVEVNRDPARGLGREVGPCVPASA